MIIRGHDITELADVFFNGRRAIPRGGAPRPGAPDPATIGQLIARGESLVLADGKLYKITVTPQEVKPK